MWNVTRQQMAPCTRPIWVSVTLNRHVSPEAVVMVVTACQAPSSIKPGLVPGAHARSALCEILLPDTATTVVLPSLVGSIWMIVQFKNSMVMFETEAIACKPAKLVTMTRKSYTFSVNEVGMNVKP